MAHCPSATQAAPRPDLQALAQTISVPGYHALPVAIPPADLPPLSGRPPELIVDPTPIVEPKPVVEPEPVADENLPVITAGERTGLPGPGFGDNPGTILVKLGDATLKSKVEKWESEEVVFVAPDIELMQSSRAVLVVVLADGSTFAEVPVILTPQLQNSSAVRGKYHVWLLIANKKSRLDHLSQRWSCRPESATPGTPPTCIEASRQRSNAVRRVFLFSQNGKAPVKRHIGISNPTRRESNS